MNLENIAPLWQDQPSDLDVNLQQVQQEGVRRQRQLFWRDLRELLATALVVLGFGVILVVADNGLARVGAGFTLVGCALTFGLLLGARRLARTPPDASLREQLQAELTQLDRQILLLRKVLWWYLLPLLGGAILVFAGFSGQWGWSLVYALAVLVFGAWVWWLNQRAWRRKLMPQRQRLAELMDRLDADA
ncbi:hypothetical protein BGP77_08030 [Saccharospirillum sp. MSK14-1]|uniref:hypothetical protein n=1 Tax=Saccharospirillum sp. MSK14-1 TaxID=1897632 RepID=UPI000D3B07FE|nr:hypothetical protein [Saccharospirillum sp. MSK14-1]PTY37204.1 hypothetical protein BGP77_08030 [Saccharospirillum sp. MSK14-1]